MRRLNILQVSSHDVAGGAERVAWSLFDAYRRRGHRSALVVGRKRDSDPDVVTVPNDQVGSAWSRAWWRAHEALQPMYAGGPVGRSLCRLTHRIAAPKVWLCRMRGVEDFEYPGTWRIPGVLGPPPDVIHCHNLHNGYFDLRALPSLCAQATTIVTLHDSWLLTGHCAHSFDCERWTTGCGACPDLNIYPAIRRDATAYNWQRKRRIYEQCRLAVATPCRWLMERVERSILAPAIIDARVIHNGVDLSTFRPGDRSAARRTLGLPVDVPILLFAASGIRANPWKDFTTFRAAVDLIARRRAAQEHLFVALGDASPAERIERSEIRFVPFDPDRSRVASYYQAADVYVHAARADTFPNTILEAMACGTPVVATAVGGIDEQVRSLGGGLDGRPAHDIDRATGILVAPKDPVALAWAIERLLDGPNVRRRLSDNAAADARERFDLERQVGRYLDWYAELIERRESQSSAQSTACSSAIREAYV